MGSNEAARVYLAYKRRSDHSAVRGARSSRIRRPTLALSMTHHSGITSGRVCATLAMLMAGTSSSTLVPRKATSINCGTPHEFASMRVNVIAVYGTPATRAARQITSTTPIVMIAVGDPVRARLAAELAHPFGNITGNSIQGPDLIGKRIEILKECVPGLARVAFLWNPDNDSNVAFLEALIIAVPALGLQASSGDRSNQGFRQKPHGLLR